MKTVPGRSLWLAVAGLGLTLIALTALLPGVVAGPSVTAEFPRGEFALRVYYQEHEDLRALQGFDLWPVHNQDER